MIKPTVAAAIASKNPPPVKVATREELLAFVSEERCYSDLNGWCLKMGFPVKPTKEALIALAEEGVVRKYGKKDRPKFCIASNKNPIPSSPKMLPGPRPVGRPTPTPVAAQTAPPVAPQPVLETTGSDSTALAKPVVANITKPSKKSKKKSSKHAPSPQVPRAAAPKAEPYPAHLVPPNQLPPPPAQHPSHAYFPGGSFPVTGLPSGSVLGLSVITLTIKRDK